jgi:1,4-dihydroxy-2-naphthoate octaprenyltransferase
MKKTEKGLAGLKIARLQFYPMSWLAYSLGAIAYSMPSGRLSASRYLVGYTILFLIELCTILANEYFDYDSDRQNRNYSIFTGGTRVLVEERLSFRDVRIGIWVGLAIITILSIALVMISANDSPLSVLFLLILGLFLGLGYTVPPLKFSYRGFGELVVGLTHSIYVILCGFVFQGGLWSDPFPWLLSVPLFFAVLGTNTLAGIPDMKADGAVLKRSIAVVFGPRTAVIFAIWCFIIAFISGLVLAYFQLFPVSILFWSILVIPHGLLLLFFVVLFLRSNNYEGRINGLMGLAMAYIIWFGLLPIIAIW